MVKFIALKLKILPSATYALQSLHRSCFSSQANRWRPTADSSFGCELKANLVKRDFSHRRFFPTFDLV